MFTDPSRLEARLLRIRRFVDDAAMNWWASLRLLLPPRVK
jgi:hypothetical protein